jgi:hypothetical protein
VPTNRHIAIRRGLGLTALSSLVILDLLATGWFGGSERELAVIRSIILPGLAFVEWIPALGISVITLSVFSVWLWLRWGATWPIVLVMMGSVVTSATVLPLHSHEGGPGIPFWALTSLTPLSLPSSAAEVAPIAYASHEFTIVLIIFALVGQLKGLLDRLPGMARLYDRLPSLMSEGTIALARSVSLSSFAGTRTLPTQLAEPTIGPACARLVRTLTLRSGPTPMANAFSAYRLALIRTDALSPAESKQWVAECRVNLTGVPCSEPGWNRLLDGTLAALSLDPGRDAEAISRWQFTLRHQLRLRHGRRASSIHLPTMLSLGVAPLWEHALSLALAHQAGWLDAREDWAALRPHCLGLAAGGDNRPATLRLIAAGRLWCHLLGDSEAAEILKRRTLSSDPIALATHHLVAPAKT